MVHQEQVLDEIYQLRRHFWARQILEFLAQIAYFDKFRFQFGVRMLKGRRLEMFSDQKFFLVIRIDDRWIQRPNQAPDLCNAPRFSKALDYLVLGPENNRRR